MSCAPVKEEFNYTVNYSSECFTIRWDSQKAELISLEQLCKTDNYINIQFTIVI